MSTSRARSATEPASNRETLEVHFKGKTIADVLNMPIEEAAEFFAAVPAIARHMETLVQVGLGYVRLGQPAPTLSGGEAPRQVGIRAAEALHRSHHLRSRRAHDRPALRGTFASSSGHPGLVDKGNTVIVIEHNLDVIKSADWIVDLGPEGGSGGGLVIAEGTPEEVANDPASHTGRFLAPCSPGRRAPPPGPRARLAGAGAKSVTKRPAATDSSAGTRGQTAAAPRTAAAKKAPAKPAACQAGGQEVDCRQGTTALHGTSRAAAATKRAAG